MIFSDGIRKTLIKLKISQNICVNSFKKIFIKLKVQKLNKKRRLKFLEKVK